MSLGSCFAANMGHQLKAHKFDISVNPGGILFNPVSMARLLRMALDNVEQHQPAPFRQAKHLPVWHHLDLHSDMNRRTQKEAEDNLTRLLSEMKQRLSELDVLIVTFGTARVYYTHHDKRVVANCHKYPHDMFGSRLLTTRELHQIWEPLHTTLLSLRPNLQIILTVSPVRHTRDGLPENSVSKALLRVFCEEWVQNQQQQDQGNGENDNNVNNNVTTPNVHYFPAFEIMMDDLRDYRFYEQDMVHPNETAQQYIWEAFQATLMDDHSREQVSRWTQINKDMKHRPNYPESDSHIHFLESIQKKLRQ